MKDDLGLNKDFVFLDEKMQKIEKQNELTTKIKDIMNKQYKIEIKYIYPYKLTFGGNLILDKWETDFNLSQIREKYKQLEGYIFYIKGIKLLKLQKNI